MRFQISVLVVAMALVGCTKPTDVTIPSDMAQWDKELAPAIKKLSSDDQKLLQGYLMRAKISEAFSKGAAIPVGTTVGTAIAEQRKWAEEQEILQAAERAKAAEEKALKEKLAQEEAAARAKLSNAVRVVLMSKGQEPSNPRAGRYSDRQTFTIGVLNKSVKAITGVSGKLEFIDMFDKVVGAVSFGITEPIEPGFDVKWEGARDYNQFIAEHRAVWNLEEGRYTTRFVPEAIVFADGTKITAAR